MTVVRAPGGQLLAALPAPFPRAPHHGRLAHRLAGLVVLAVVAACGGGAGASPVVVAPSLAAAPQATPAPSPAADRTATAVPSSTPVPATPAPSMPASLLGTWKGTVSEPNGVVKEFAETYLIEPCDGNGICGSFEVTGPVVEERLDAYPWARMGMTVRCSGVLMFDRMEEDEALFVAASTSADPPESLGTCGKMPFGLRPAAGGGLTFTGFAWGKVVLQRGLLLPAEAAPAAG